jgi:plastocyanin
MFSDVHDGGARIGDSVLLVLGATVLIVAAVVLGVGGSDREYTPVPVGGTQRAAENPGEEQEVAITARDIAFDVDHVDVAAGTVHVVLDHQDDGILHNIRVTGPGGVDAATPIEAGPVHQDLTVDLSTAGTYSFVCDVHPTMVGAIEAT